MYSLVYNTSIQIISSSGYFYYSRLSEYEVIGSHNRVSGTILDLLGLYQISNQNYIMNLVVRMSHRFVFSVEVVIIRSDFLSRLYIVLQSVYIMTNQIQEPSTRYLSFLRTQINTYISSSISQYLCSTQYSICEINRIGLTLVQTRQQLVDLSQSIQ